MRRGGAQFGAMVGSARQGKHSTRVAESKQAGASATTPVGVVVNPSKVRRCSLSPLSVPRAESVRRESTTRIRSSLVIPHLVREYFDSFVRSFYRAFSGMRVFLCVAKTGNVPATAHVTL